MTECMKDIRTEKDVILLVERFYEKVLQDPLLSPFFRLQDFNKHHSRMVHFWSFVLLDRPGYTTNVTEKHTGMRLNKQHYDRWVTLFRETVDELFAGEKAALAKQRSFVMGWTMAAKLED